MKKERQYDIVISYFLMPAGKFILCINLNIYHMVQFSFCACAAVSDAVGVQWG